MNYHTTRLRPFGLCLQASNPGSDIDSVDVAKLRSLFRTEHLILLRGFRSFPTAEAFAAYCERWGGISLWPFGKVLELKEQKNPEDHIFDNNYVPLHWDGMYRPQVPEYQVFQCVEAPRPGQGGRTTFSHTARAVARAEADTLALWQRVTGHYQRKMEFYDSKTVSPIVTTHPRRGFPVIRYNEPPSFELKPFLNPPTLHFSGLVEGELEEFHRSLKAALYDPAVFYAHEWQAGDVIIADNYSLLHGREGFETAAPRHLRRIHVLGDPPLDNPGLVSHR